MHTDLRHIVVLTGLLLGMAAASLANAAEAFHFRSAAEQATLLELYTSEGCSSCPPADRWFSHLTDDPRLWHQLIPVAFHVDYWNDLGWRDRFSRAAFSSRQRRYAGLHYSNSVYTPGFFSNGREWRNWFYLREPELHSRNRPGILQLTLRDNTLEARFDSLTTPPTALVLNVALLGFNLVTTVKAGENQGKQLRHDFVALALHNYRGHKDGKSTVWQQSLAPATQRIDADAIACWISTEDDPTPLQATGGWLHSLPNDLLR